MRPWTAFFTPEPPTPSKPAKGGKGGDLPLRYTSLLASALECGIPWNVARGMRFNEVTLVIRAHNDAHSTSDDKSSKTPDGQRVRKATSGDIKKVFG